MIDLFYMKVDIIVLYSLFILVICINSTVLLKLKAAYSAVPNIGNIINSKWLYFFIVEIVFVFFAKYIVIDNLLIGLFNEIYNLRYILLFGGGVIISCAFLYRNKSQYITSVSNFIYSIGYIILISGIISNQIVITLYFNWLLLILSLPYHILSFLNEHIKAEPDYRISMLDDAEIYKLEDFFDSRDKFLLEVTQYIHNRKSNIPHTVCISGEWGTGKTSFIRVLLSTINCDYIYLNLKDLDDLNSVYRSFSSQLYSIMKSHVFYCGHNSAFKKYLKMALDIANNKVLSTLGTLIIKDSIELSESVRSTEELVESIVRSGKQFLIIIDDIDRCQPEKVKNLLIYAKEVMSIKNTITFFLCDYNKLTEICGRDYLSKFIGKKFDLPIMKYQELINQFLTEATPSQSNKATDITLYLENECFKYIEPYLGKSFDSITRIIISKKSTLITQKDESKVKLQSSIEELILRKSDLYNAFNNSRKLKVFLSEIVNLCYKFDIFYSHNFHSKTDYRKYIKLSKAVECILFISVIKTYFPDEYEKSLSIDIIEYINQNTDDFIKSFMHDLTYRPVQRSSFSSFETEGVLQALVNNKEKLGVTLEQETYEVFRVRQFFEEINSTQHLFNPDKYGRSYMLELLKCIIRIDSFESAVDNGKKYKELFSFIINKCSSLNTDLTWLFDIFENMPELNHTSFVHQFYNFIIDKIDLVNTHLAYKQLATFINQYILFAYNFSSNLKTLMNIAFADKGFNMYISLNNNQDYISLDAICRFWQSVFPAIKYEILEIDYFEGIVYYLKNIIDDLGLKNNQIDRQFSIIDNFIADYRNIDHLRNEFTLREEYINEPKSSSISRSIDIMFDLNSFMVPGKDNKYHYYILLTSISNEYKNKIMSYEDLYSIKRFLHCEKELKDNYIFALPHVLNIERTQYCLRIIRCLQTRLNSMDLKKK